MIEYVNRKSTHSFKWDYILEKFNDKEMLPCWVADMDFKTSLNIIETIKKYADKGAYGYTLADNEYFDSVSNWYKRYNCQIKKGTILFSPGVVSALSFAIKALTNENDKIIVNMPVYHPFFDIIKKHNRVVENVPLIYSSNSVDMDWEKLESSAKKSKLFLLCSPHNPIGRVWNYDELKRIEEIVIKNDLILIADEIHGDLVLWNNEFVSILSLSDELKKRSIVCTSPSKSFNIAGLQSSNIIIENKEYFFKIKQNMEMYGIFGPNYFAAVATISAYNDGWDWLKLLKNKIEENYILLVSKLKLLSNKIKIFKPMATYLVWIDFNKIISDPVILEELLISNSIYASQGYEFGLGGNCFIRINIATSSENIVKIAERIVNAICSFVKS